MESDNLNRNFIENQKRQIDLANQLIEYANDDLIIGLAKKNCKLFRQKSICYAWFGYKVCRNTAK